jgi:hypothetical protein
MINIEKSVTMSCAEVMKGADIYFLKNGLSCDENDSENFRACYSGGGGYVRIQCCPEGKSARIHIEGREWDYQIKQFMANL